MQENIRNAYTAVTAPELPQETDVVSQEAGQNGKALKDEDEMSLKKGAQDPEALYQQLVNSILRYHPSDDMSQIRSAYELAREGHKNQKRHSGEPYIIHPLHVAIILAEMEMDKESIISGLLHDVVEDTDVTLDEIREKFGDDVATIVDGVTKLTRLNLGDMDKLQIQAENLRKMFLSMSKDIRIIIVKLADRLHNMRTLEYQRVEKQREKAAETLDIYAPLADRLGIFRVKMELDNLSLAYLEPRILYPEHGPEHHGPRQERRHQRSGLRPHQAHFQHLQENADPEQDA